MNNSIETTNNINVFGGFGGFSANSGSQNDANDANDTNDVIGVTDVSDARNGNFRKDNLSLGSKVEDSLQRYISKIQSIPMLSAGDELMLANDYINNGNVLSANKLVESHLKLVLKVAFQYKNYGLPIMDLVSEGTLGLMMAVKKFNPNMGNRLATYAMWWIKANIQSFILQSWSLVKIGTTNAKRKLFFSLNKIKSKLGLASSSLSEDEIAQLQSETGASAKEIKEVEIRMFGKDGSIDQPITKGNDSGTVADFIASDIESPEEICISNNSNAIAKQSIADALNSLSSRERRIVEARVINEKAESLKDLSKEFGISCERVRQIFVKSLNKLHGKLAQSI